MARHGETAMKKPMSAELQQMLNRPRQDPMRITTRPMRRLERRADKWLAKSGFFHPMDEAEKAIRQEAENYNLRGYYSGPNR